MNKKLTLIICLLICFSLNGRTIVVTNNADFGVNTLRGILNNQAQPGDIITFNITPATIQLNTGTLVVPAGNVNQPITIDGTSQPGVQIIVAPGSNFDALSLSSFDVVKGLTITGARTAITAGSNNQITNSFIGTNSAGTSTNPNGTGISLTGNSNTISNTLISGNTGVGISLAASSASNTISNNKIGVSPAGTALGNGSFGIQVASSNNTFTGNTISFQTGSPGVSVSGSSNTFTSNTINNNASGGIVITGNSNTLSSNTFDSNRGPGITINTTASLNIIGSSAQTANTVTNNIGAGIVVGSNLTDLALQNQIEFNSIANNTLLGIDLGNLRVPLTQQPNPSPGPNHLQNAPVIQTAQLECNGDVTIAFLLDSDASTSYLIQFFSNTLDRNPGITEGERFIGSTTVTTDAQGIASASITFTPSAPASGFISATATNMGTLSPGDTSEFSSNVSLSTPFTPNVTISSNRPSFVTCAGNSITLTATVTNEPGPFNFLWSTGATTQSITVSPTTTTIYTVTVTNPAGCKGSALQQVTVNPLPTIGLTASSTSLCTGSSVVLTATPAGLVRYQFFANGTALGPAQTTNTFITTPTAASTTYTVTATDLSGCQGTSPGVVVSTNSIPRPVLTASRLTPCIESTITLTALPEGLNSYQFFANGTALGPTQTTNTFMTSPGLGTTTYTVTATQNNCQGTSASIAVTTQPCPIILISKLSSKKIFPNDTVSFTIKLQNIGSVPATGVVVTDVLPSCLTFKKATGMGWTFDKKGQTLTAELPFLGIGEKVSFTLTATACCPLTPSEFTNTATVVSDTTDEVASKPVTITVVPNPCCKSCN